MGAYIPNAGRDETDKGQRCLQSSIITTVALVSKEAPFQTRLRLTAHTATLLIHASSSLPAMADVWIVSFPRSNSITRADYCPRPDQGLLGQDYMIGVDKVHILVSVQSNSYTGLGFRPFQILHRHVRFVF